jgi:hypothetical protein
MPTEDCNMQTQEVDRFYRNHHNDVRFLDDQVNVKSISVVVVICGAVDVIGWKYLPFT